MHSKLEKLAGVKLGDRVFTEEELMSFSYDLLEVDHGKLHLIYESESINIEVIELDLDQKKISLSIDGVKYHYEVKDRLDQLVERLGFDKIKQADAKEIKAPMPGLVLDVLVKPGQPVSAGDDLIILEAMKMENVLQAPNDGIIKSIEVKKSNPVEKNQILINFE